MFEFATDCVGSTYEAISALKESERPIGLRTFREAIGVPAWRDIQKQLGYGNDFRISRDWHVGYYKGTYLGRRAVFIRWSGIEYIFTKEDT